MKRACQPLQCSLFAALLIVGSAWAQEVDVNSSPNVVGSGARALGMGGAFIAIADDATAASWNPGGLTQLERPEISLVLSRKWLGEDINSGPHPELEGDHSVTLNDINYLSFVYPVRRTIAGRNLVFSLNYQRKLDFDRDLKLRLYRRGYLGGAAGIHWMQRVSQETTQEGSLSTLSPAFGFELTERLSVGLVMNIWDESLIESNGWSKDTDFRFGVLYDNGALFRGYGAGRIEEDYDNFRGINYTFGLSYRATERLNFGMVYHTKFTADVDYTQRRRQWSIGQVPIITKSQREQEIVFPSAIGLGVSYRFPNDKLTLALDVTRREWDQFVVHDNDAGLGDLRLIRQILADGITPGNTVGNFANVARNFIGLRQNRRTSGVTGTPASQVNIDPTYTIRLGGEYVFVDETKPKQNILPSLRAGIFYDPEPSSGRRTGLLGLDSGDGSPDDYYGIALGLGLLFRDRVNLDFAYTYRWGRGVGVDSFGFADTDEDMDQHIFYVSTVVYF